MSDMSDLKCPPKGLQLEHMRYFPRQLMTAEDMRVEQEYFRQKMRRHNRYLHGWGVVCGCDIEAAPTEEQPWRVRVCPGYAMSPQGDEILIDEPAFFDLALGSSQPDPCAVKWPCPPEAASAHHGQERILLYLAVRYAECFTRPVRVHPSGCGCDETQCEYSRVRESFELKLLQKLPESHEKAQIADDQWLTTLVNGEDRWRMLVPPCPECPEDPWIVLASITLPVGDNTDKKADITKKNILYEDRRALWSRTAIQVAMRIGG